MREIKKIVLAISFVKGMGKAKVYKFIKQYNVLSKKMSLNEVTTSLKTMAENDKKIILPSNDEMDQFLQRAETILDKAEEDGIMTILMESENYPRQFMSLTTPPAMIFAKGNIRLLKEENCVTIIGTRDVSDHGAKVAERLGAIFANRGYVVVSGLANGCDAGVHKGCLDKKGKTIAILPSPINNIQPKSNIELANDILENEGLIISAYYPGQALQKSFYVERDELQSIISKGVVVVECSLKSGTMRTVEYAQKYKKRLACYYAKFQETRSTGNVELVQSKKAIPLKNDEDIDLFDKLIKSECNLELQNEQLQMYI